jgi:hypothetical protein
MHKLGIEPKTWLNSKSFTLAHCTTRALLNIKYFLYLYYNENHVYCFDYILGSRHAMDMIIDSLESY